jgi:hypothetical protein
LATQDRLDALVQVEATHRNAGLLREEALAEVEVLDGKSRADNALERQ